MYVCVPAYVYVYKSKSQDFEHFYANNLAGEIGRSGELGGEEGKEKNKGLNGKSFKWASHIKSQNDCEYCNWRQVILLVFNCFSAYSKSE